MDQCCTLRYLSRIDRFLNHEQFISTMELNLRGGVIVIGSLYWEDSKIRRDWRDNSLIMKQGVKIALPMRYGRKSSTRHNTYTMVFSMNCPKPGVGYAIPFSNSTKTVQDLKQQAMTVASAERNENYDSTLDWQRWGALGILLNPSLASRPNDSKTLTDTWAGWYSQKFLPATYKGGKTEEPPIDQRGILQFDWPKEVTLDFLIATVINPETKRYPSATQIACAMYNASCYNYFVQNRKSGIETYRDGDILQLLKTKYNLTSYLRENGIA